MRSLHEQLLRDAGLADESSAPAPRRSLFRAGKRLFVWLGGVFGVFELMRLGWLATSHPWRALGLLAGVLALFVLIDRLLPMERDPEISHPQR